MVSAIGGFFEGQYLNGKKHGFGREIFADGGYMLATYCQDKFDGLCTHFDAEGAVVSETKYDSQFW